MWSIANTSVASIRSIRHFINALQMEAPPSDYRVKTVLDETGREGERDPRGANDIGDEGYPP